MLRRVDKADLKLALFDASDLGDLNALSDKAPATLDALTASLVDKDTVVVFSKSDLLRGASASRAPIGGLKRAEIVRGVLEKDDAKTAGNAPVFGAATQRLLAHAPRWFATPPAAVCVVSCESSAGLPELLAELTKQVQSRLDVSDSNEPVITRVRHRTHLRECVDFMQRFEATRGEDLVLASEHLRQATRALGRIVGRVDADQLLDVIFRDFCIGK